MGAPRREILLLAGLLVLAAVTVFWDADRPFNQADEAWYAEIVERMIADGDYVTPRFGPEPDFIKPPLSYWLSVPAMAVLPSPRVAMRLVPGLCFLAMIVLVWAAARRRFGGAAGLWAAAAFFLTYDHLHLHVYRAGVPDALTNLLIALVWWLAIELPERPGRWRAIGAVLGLLFLTKTVFVAIPIAFLIALGVIERKRWRPPLAIVAQGVVIAIVVAAPWFVAVLLTHGWSVIDTMFVDQVWKRAIHDGAAAATGRTFGRTEPLYAWQHVFAFGQPWVVVAIGAVVKAVSLLRTSPPAEVSPDGEASRDGEASADDRARRRCLQLAIVWIAVVMAMFTISRGVWGWYLSSAYVPIAVLAGWAIADLVAGRGSPTVTALLGAAAAAAPIVAPGPFYYNPYVNSSVLAPLGEVRGFGAGLTALLLVVGARLARKASRGEADAEAGAWRMTIAGTGVAFVYATVLWWRFGPPTRDLPLWVVVAPVAAIGVALVVAGALLPAPPAPASRRRRAMAAALLVAGASYLVAPLRFAGRDNERPEMAWREELLEATGRGETVVRRANYYSWIVAYYHWKDDFEIRYDETAQELTFAPKDR